MIRPPGLRGGAFSSAADGDLSKEGSSREAFSRLLGVSEAWATVTQVHGASVVRAHRPGDLGEGDGVFTTKRGLPIAVFVADCVPVIMEGSRAVGVAHAGWRGLLAGVIRTLLEAMAEADAPPVRAAIGPSIGPCCYEVGEDVAGKFPDFMGLTTWGSPSVDLAAAASAQLEGLELEKARRCTYHEGWFSHRRDATPLRQAGVAWVP